MENSIEIEIKLYLVRDPSYKSNVTSNKTFNSVTI